MPQLEPHRIISLFLRNSFAQKSEPQDWKGLEASNKLPEGTLSRNNLRAGGNTAPSPYASKKDWNSVEKQVIQEDEKDKPEGQDALHKLFQQIFANGDPETKRAMMKSYQTSGGTVLSTNWNEVVLMHVTLYLYVLG